MVTLDEALRVASGRRRKCLFFSRGRGKGHAIPDMAIADILQREMPDLDIELVSYATGAQALAEAGRLAADLRLPEENEYLATVTRCRDVILDRAPDVVLAHEEFAAIFAAHLADAPSLFLSAYLPPLKTVQCSSLSYAQAVVIFEQPGIFPVPELHATRLVFTGPFVREMRCARDNRKALREGLALPKDGLILLVAPGGWATEARSPLLATVLAAFAELRAADKYLVWLGGSDYENIARAMGANERVRVLKRTDEMDALLCASDLVITKANRSTVMEAASLGIPSVSLCFGHNSVDEALVARVKSDLMLSARATDGKTLAFHIERILADPARRTPPCLELGGSLRRVCRVIAAEINRMTPFCSPACERAAPALS